VLGAGIVGTSIALHLAKRGLSVALIDRAGVGEQTSYGNAGVIEGNTVFPPAFPSDPGALARIALKRAAARHRLNGVQPGKGGDCRRPILRRTGDADAAALLVENVCYGSPLPIGGSGIMSTQSAASAASIKLSSQL
jgi:glycine/D-amino acid oxidase-like deaminating enzyme